MSRRAVAWRVCLLGAASSAALLATAMAMGSAPRAYVYWTVRGGGSGTTIGRANLNGTAPNPSFIGGATGPVGIAVDGSYVYWANTFGSQSTIGRAKLDGTGVDQSFISGASSPCGVAVDGSHLYWANNGSSTIGRANLNGTGVDQSFITGATHPCGVAVNGSFVYWANESGTTIGRANLDGSSPNESFITGLSNPVGVAVDGSHIYWGNNSSNTLGRANLDGTGADNSFIPGSGGCTDFPAVDSTYVYWNNDCASSIGRANLDGSGVNEGFIATAANPGGVAVSGSTRPSCTIRAKTNAVMLSTKKSVHKKKPKGKPGTLQFVVRCDQATSITLTGKVVETLPIKKGEHHGKKRRVKSFALRTVRATAQAHVAATLTIKLPAAALAALTAHRRESIVVTLAAANANGTSTATAKIAKLKARKR